MFLVPKIWVWPKLWCDLCVMHVFFDMKSWISMQVLAVIASSNWLAWLIMKEVIFLLLPENKGLFEGFFLLGVSVSWVRWLILWKTKLQLKLQKWGKWTYCKGTFKWSDLVCQLIGDIRRVEQFWKHCLFIIWWF